MISMQCNKDERFQNCVINDTLSCVHLQILTNRIHYRNARYKHKPTTNGERVIIECTLKKNKNCVYIYIVEHRRQLTLSLVVIFRKEIESNGTALCVLTSCISRNHFLFSLFQFMLCHNGSIFKIKSFYFLSLNINVIHFIYMFNNNSLG